MNNIIVEVINCLDDYRNIFDNIFSDIRDKFGLLEESHEDISVNEDQFISNQQNYENYINRLFNQIKNIDKNFYTFLITMLYHDQCIMLNTADDDYRNDNLELLNELKDKVKTSDDLINLIENDYTYLMDMIVFFLDFCKLNYYEKRKKILSCNDINNYLQKIYKFNIIDTLYYTKKIYLEDLVKMYNDSSFLNFFGKNINPMNFCVRNIQNLFYSDIENSYELVVSLLNKSYKYLLYEYEIKRINNNITFNLNNLVKNKDLEMISYEVINNDDYLSLILKYFYEEEFKYDDKYKEQVELFYNLKDNEKIKRKLMVNDSGSN